MSKNTEQKLPFIQLYHEAARRGAQGTLVGEPCLPMRPEFLSGLRAHLDRQQKAVAAARTCFGEGDIDGAATFCSEDGMRAVEGYGDPQGERQYRERMAATLNKLYKLSPEKAYTADEILFTAGATGSLSALTQHINKDEWVVVPSPYHMWHHSAKIIPMPVAEKGFTAEGLNETLMAARRAGREVKEIRLCDPQNPMGYATSRGVWEKVAEILRSSENQGIKVTIDEAYAEVAFDGHTSLVEVAPDLKDRITIIRTIGKGFSATGYRAGIVAASKERVQEIMGPNIDVYFKVPPEIQAGYTEVLEWYADHQQGHHDEMRRFYQTQVEQVVARTGALDIAYKGKDYRPQTFYALMDLHELKGLPLSDDAKRILGSANTSGIIESDVDIAAYLLAEKNIALFPLSYYQHDSSACILRVTCGQGPLAMGRVMDAVESIVRYAREPEQQRVHQAYMRTRTACAAKAS